MTVNPTENAKGPVGYGNVFCTKPFSRIDKRLMKMKLMPADKPNTASPEYETFALQSIWYNVCNGRWPHLRAYENHKSKTCGCMLRDWTQDYVLISSPFDMGPFEVIVGLRIPIATLQNIHNDLRDEIFIGLFTEDEQCLAEYLNDESMEFLALFMQQLRPMKYHMDFECDPFFYREVPHTKGLESYMCLLDHLETVYNSNSPDILCPTNSSTYLRYSQQSSSLS